MNKQAHKYAEPGSSSNAGRPVVSTLLLSIFLLVLTSVVRADVAKVDGDQLTELLDEGMPIIDVRRPDEWKETGVVEGSHLLTFFDNKGNYNVEEWLAELHKVVAKDEPFILICAVGGRTATISKFLDTRLGYNGVHDAAGGIRRWIKSGRAVVAVDVEDK